MTAPAEAIRALVEGPLASSGLELWDVEVARGSVRVLVDRPGGIDLDALASLAGQVVSPLLDEHPELTPDGQYLLEVSSPGVERPLRRQEHYERYTGSEVAVKTSVPVAGARRHQGTLVSVDPECVTLATPDHGPVVIRHTEIERARTVLQWGPAPKPGAKQDRSRKDPAVKRPAAGGREPADRTVASRQKESE